MEKQSMAAPDVTSSFNPPELDSLGLQCEASFSQSSSDLDEDKCYQLQIEQLKRQNNFLKKKLAELNKKQRSSLPTTTKKRPPSFYGVSSQKHLEEHSKNYLIGFIEEVMKLLESFSTLFRIEFQTTLDKQLQQQNEVFNELTSQKHTQVHQRLTRILLEPEQKKYGQVLDLFATYYKENAEKNRIIRQRVEGLTTQAIELGKRMAENILQRQHSKRSMKGSHLIVVRDPTEMRPFKEGYMDSSAIKSTCTDQNFEFRSCHLGQGKQKTFLNIF